MVATDSNRQPKILSFDIYGTLVDVLAPGVRFFETIAAAANQEPQLALSLYEQWEQTNIQAYAQIPYRPYREIAAHSLSSVLDSSGIRGVDVDAALRRWFDGFGALRAFDDVRPTLSALRRTGHRIALISNLDRALVQATPLSFEYDTLLTSDEVECYKPDGALFRHLLSGLGVSREDVLHFGQSQYTDLVGCGAAGLRCVWVNRRRLVRGRDVPAPSYEIEELSQASKVLDQTSTGRPSSG